MTSEGPTGAARAVLLAAIVVASVPSVAVAGVGGAGDGLAGASTGDATVVADDRFEPNDDRGNATPVGNGTYRSLDVEDGESDWYAVELTAGDTLSAAVDFDHGVGNLDMRVYGPDGDRLDRSRSVSDGESVDTGPVQDAGTYHVEVYGYAGASAPYDLSVNVTRGSPPGPDRFEPNDAFLDAEAVDPGTVEGLTITEGDRDYFRVVLRADEALVVDASFAIDRAEFNLSVLGPNLTRVAASTSSEDGESVTVTPGFGTYYVVVDGVREATSPYELTVRTPKVDRFEPNDDAGNATPVGEGTYRNLTVVDDERDFYAVDLSAGDTITASVDSDGPAWLILQGPGGPDDFVVLNSTTDPTLNVGPVPDSGEYRLVVQRSRDRLVGTYDLTVDVTEPPPVPADRFESNDDAGNATPVEDGEYAGLGIAEGDTDRFAVSRSAGDSLSVLLEFEHNFADIDVRILGPNGTDLAASTSTSDDERVVVDHVPFSGTYTVVVSAPSDRSARYDLEVAEEPPTRRIEAVLDGSTPTVRPGERFDVEIELRNRKNKSPYPAALELRSIPDAVSVTRVDTRGQYKRAGGEPGEGDEIVWSNRFRLPDPGEAVFSEFGLRVSPNATPGTYPLRFKGVLWFVNGAVRDDAVVVVEVVGNTTGRFDLDGDGRIGVSDVLTTVRAYNAGWQVDGAPVTARDVLAVVAAFHDDDGG